MAEGEPSRRPFYEHRRWLAGMAVLTAVTAVWALIGAPTPWKIFDDIFSSELPGSNTEIVLDASAAMGDPFGSSGTKLDAAADAVGSFAVPFTNEGLALRDFGGGCDEAGELLVDFGEDHGDDVRDAAAEQQPGGDSNLANAVIAAIDDFADVERFPDPDSPKRVVVFTGAVDDCLGESAAGEIRREVERTGIDAVFKLVGVKVSAEDRGRLRSLRNGLGANAEVVFADTEEELTEVVEGLEESPIPARGRKESETTTSEEAPSDESGAAAPADGFALNKRGFNLIRKGRYEEAIPLLERAVERLRGSGVAHGACDEDAGADARGTCYAYALFNLGQALRLAGQPDAAIPILRRRLEIPIKTRVVRKELKAARADAGGQP
jgi:tetratricopeptide (TPR) repeat protein